MRRRALGGTAPAFAERALLMAATQLENWVRCAGESENRPTGPFFARNRDPKFATNRSAPPSTNDRLTISTISI